MKIQYLLLFIPLHLTFGAVEKEYVIDFRESFSMDAFTSAGVPLQTPSSVVEDPDRRTLPNDARYVFKLPSSNTLIVEAHMGHVAYAHKDRSRAGRLVLYGNKPKYHLTTEEAYAVLSGFHETFEIPKEALDEWFEPIKNNQLASSFYQAIAKKQYPEIALELANSFFDEKPVFLVYYLDFDEKTLRKRGVSAETNKVKNLTFDVPAIIDSVRPETAVAEIPADLSAPEAVQVVEEVKQPKPAKEEPAEVAPVEVAEETPEQSSNWWLWLIGVVVVVGGIALAVRRKS